MHKILAVVRREYLAGVATKMFWIGTLAFPLFFAVIIGVSVGVQFVSPETQKPLAVIDETSELGPRVAEQLERQTLDDGSPEYTVEIVAIEGDVESARRALEPRVLDGDLYGILTIGSDIEAADNHKLYRRSVGDHDAARTIRSAITEAAIGLRLERSDLDIGRERLDALVRRTSLESYQVTHGETRQKDPVEAMVATFGFVIMLFFTLYFYGFAITRGIIQEKTNRVIEVLLGSLSSEQLMTGKIIGLGLVGLTQVGIYAVVGGGMRLAVASFSAQGDLFGDALATFKLVYFVVFFLLGYFLFATFFAVVGAACSTEQDAQSLQFPVMLTLLIPYMTTFFFVKHPDSTPALIASFIPLFAPMIMFMRISVLTPPFWQIALSMLIMLAAIYVMFRVAGKVFRIGSLMYGKRPKISEIIRWARSGT